MTILSLDGPALLELIQKEQAAALEHSRKMYGKLPAATRGKIVKSVIQKETLSAIFHHAINFTGLNTASEFVKDFGINMLGNAYAKFWEEDTRTFVISSIENAIERFKGNKVDLVNLFNLPDNLKLGRDLIKKLWNDVKEVAKCAVLYTYGDDINKPIIQKKAFEAFLSFKDTVRSLAPGYFLNPLWFSLHRFKSINKNEPSHIKNETITLLKQVGRDWYKENPTLIPLDYFKNIRIDILSDYLYLLNDEDLETIRQYHLEQMFYHHVKRKPMDISASSHFDYVINNVKMIMAWDNK